MVEYLQKLLQTSNGFTVNICWRDGSDIDDVGLLAADEHGIVYVYKDDPVAAPWRLIRAVRIHED